ncbi:alpha-L-rhamnosidase C-terminal domain-containing protein [Jejuia pallidilutea]|nr:alpha-L-rhamnosidase C-terminal domain-containing protein [Jejuia pallidilutea]GAL65614.1 alfa-L-rhamnosidase [Jejuia pallidilutea]GAL72668.1 alfa-L-rhamnosidase [Jejuia pallidilutea]
MNSLNHYAYGAIGQWMYERIAGIAPLEAGYKVIRIAPKPRDPLTSASAELETPYGKVSSAWEVKDGTFTLNVTVPPNTRAKVIVPGAMEAVEDTEDVKTARTETGRIELLVQSGTYTFKSKL